jgi:PAS domain S-box-containing protein
MKQLRVLVVEDDPTSAADVALALSRLGHTVCAATASGAQSVALAKQERPDVVLMDCLLEGSMDGALASRVINGSLDIPVILLTGQSPQAVLGAAGALDVAGFIQKPVRRDELAANLQIAVFRKDLERRLRESEHKYRGIFDNSLAGIFRSTPGGRYLAANRAFAAMLGYGSEQELMDSVVNIAEQVYVDPFEREGVLASLEQSDVLSGLEVRVYGRDGDVLWLSMQLTAHRTPEGRLDYMDGVAVDVTARREAQDGLTTTLNLLRQTVDSLPDPLALTDLEHNLILANRALRSRLDLDEDAPASLPDLLDAQCRPAWRAAYAFTMEEQAACEFVGRLGDGGPARRISLAPYRSPEGELIGVIYLAAPHPEALQQGTIPCASTSS